MRGGSLDINSRPAPEDSADEAPLIRIARITYNWDPKADLDYLGKTTQHNAWRKTKDIPEKPYKIG